MKFCSIHKIRPKITPIEIPKKSTFFELAKISEQLFKKSRDRITELMIDARRLFDGVNGRLREIFVNFDLPAFVDNNTIVLASIVSIAFCVASAAST